MPEDVNSPNPNESANPDPNVSPSQQGQAGNLPPLKEMLPPDLQSEKEFENYKDVASLAKAHLETKRYASKLRNEKLSVPTDKSSPEEIAAFNKAIGVPDNPDGYELPVPELPEGMQFDEEKTNKFKALAHSKGVPKAAFQALFNEYVADQKAQYEAQAKAVSDLREKTTAEFKKLWGKDFDANLSKADQTGQKVFGAEFMKLLKDTGLNNHSTVIKGLFKLSEAVGEHSFVSGGERPNSSTSVTWEKLVSMKNDPRYWDSSRRDLAYVKEVEAANEAYSKGRAN